jgi:hypothetical protein
MKNTTTHAVRSLLPGDFVASGLPDNGDGSIVESLYRDDLGGVVLTTDRHLRVTLPELTLVEVVDR